MKYIYCIKRLYCQCLPGQVLCEACLECLVCHAQVQDQPAVPGQAWPGQVQALGCVLVLVERRQELVGAVIKRINLEGRDMTKFIES